MYQLPLAVSLSFVLVIIAVVCMKAQISCVSDHISKHRYIVLVSREEATNKTKTSCSQLQRTGLKNQAPEIIFEQLTVCHPKLQAPSHSDLKSA